MGWPPAVVIVVRHGARLDAADKQWHLTSPTPYDPPLTFGGWTQSRALGARIASILHCRETDDDLPGTEGEEGGAGQVGEGGRKRKHKVIIHTSPFLRCVQTSVAISAGLAQGPGYAHNNSRAPGTTSPGLRASQMHSSPRIRPTISTGSPALAPIPEPTSSIPTLSKLEKTPQFKKALVRVDAFLGEWLSPDYFELITPPPSSIMMVAGAKVELLRREDYSTLAYARDITSTPKNQPFPGGWGSPVVVAVESWKDKDDGALSTLPSLAQALPRRDRTSSLSSVGSSGSARSLPGPTDFVPTAASGLYQVPVPNYAISTSDPIPSGYVAHARDACVEIDYQWDSMREPQNWGNGGEYGEEWSSMHKRFRKGLQNLVGWYQSTDDPGKLSTKPRSSFGQGGSSALVKSEDDEDTDLVVILVTHGAGCNALIGALTNQPVLLDVAMSSLTMAVRKPILANSRTNTPSHSRASSRTLSLSDEYDVKLVASTDHLRSSSSTPSSSRAPSVAGLGVFRERLTTNSPFDRNAASRSLGTNPNFGSIRRTASVATSVPRTYLPPSQMSIGLWSAPQPAAIEPEEEQDDMILNFGDTDAGESKVTPTIFTTAEELKPIENERDEEDAITPLGLWGAPLPPDEAEKHRILTHKRRWTVNERAI